MAHPPLHGIVPPIITPMNADESVNIPELRRQIERQIGRIDRHSVGAGGKSGARIDMQAVGGVGDDQVSRVFPAVWRRADEADV